MHEFEAELFRKQPELARELLRLCAGIDVGQGSAEDGSGDVTQVVPAEFRADAVTVIRDATRRAVAAILVEVQRSRDARKKFTWPEYVTGLRAKHECPVTLLVFAPDDIAPWASEAIEIGHPDFCLRPVVIKPGDVPVITDPTSATPELLVLSAVAHPDASMIAPLMAVLEAALEKAQRVYWTLILTAWPKALTQLLEAAMTPELEELLNKVQYEVGVQHGREEGLVVGLRRAALELAKQRGALTVDAEARILATTDQDTLMKLVIDLGSATDVDAARDALARFAAH